LPEIIGLGAAGIFYLFLVILAQYNCCLKKRHRIDAIKKFGMDDAKVVAE